MRPGKRLGSRLRGLRLYASVGVSLAVVGSLALLTLPAAGDTALARAPAQASPEEEGARVYAERCASCHGESGEGVPRSGPAILGKGAALYDFMMSTGRMPVDRPVVQAGRKRPVLSRDEIDAVTAFLVSLAPGGPPIPEVDPEAGDLSLGGRIWQLDCAACHGSGGNGGAVGDRAAPSVHPASALEVAEAVRAGPGTMPVFDEETLPQRDLDSVVRYVLYLRDFDDRGGLPLGHVGPLVEGFVAIAVGLGLLLVLTRYIGERS
ncbi:MAG: c-type cytochrome [Actinobacteria bacterium]|nr:c-type cytochrome [Actinomycetota bacterium]